MGTKFRFSFARTLRLMSLMTIMFINFQTLTLGTYGTTTLLELWDTVYDT